MTLKTLMLSAATGALLMSPALAQDDQTDDSSTEEVTVPLEGEVTIEVEVTDVETSAGDGSEDDADAEGEDESGGTNGDAESSDASDDEGDSADGGASAEDAGADTTEDSAQSDGAMSEESGESASTSDMADDGAASSDGEGMSVVGDGSDESMSDQQSGAGMDSASDTEGAMQPEEGLIAEENDDTTGTGGSGLTETGADEAETPDYGRLAGMFVGDILNMEVQTPDQRRVGDIDYLIQRDGGIEAVVGVGGFLGLGEHTVALPLEEFELVADGDRLLISRSEDELRSMTQIDESDLEELDEDLTIEQIASGL